MKPSILAVIAVLALAGCTYYGPSIGFNAGYKGVTVGVALYGQNPVNATPTPAPTPLTDVAVEIRKTNGSGK